MPNVEAAVSQVDLREAALAKTEYKLGQVATKLFGEGVFNAEVGPGGLLGQIEQTSSGKIDIDKVCPRGILDLDALKLAGVEIVKGMDEKQKLQILAASFVLKTWVVNNNGKTDTEGRDYCFRTIKDGLYEPTYETAMSVLADKFGRYDLGAIMDGISTTGGYTNEDLGKLAVAATLTALNDELPAEARGEAGTLSSEEIKYCAQAASPLEIAQRAKAATEVTAEFGNEKYGFNQQSAYFEYEGRIIKGVATTKSADGALYVLTDQKQIWWRSASGEWRPFVVLRKDQSGDNFVPSLAQTQDLSEAERKESIESISATNKKGITFTDLCPTRIADYRVPIRGAAEISEPELSQAYSAQLDRREKEALRKIQELQKDTGVIRMFDMGDMPIVKVRRADGQEDKTRMLAASFNPISNERIFARDIQFGTHPQFYIDEMGRIYSTLMKEKEDGGFSFANLNQDGDGLIAVPHQDVVYYDTGLNVAFLRSDLPEPTDHYVTLEKVNVKRSRLEPEGNSFPWYRFHVDRTDYAGTECLMFAAAQDASEQYRTLPFVVSEPGEIAKSTLNLPFRPGFARVGDAAHAFGRWLSTASIGGRRLQLRTETIGLKTITLTDLTKAEAKRELPEKIVKLEARTKHAYPDASLNWDIRDSHNPIKISAVAPGGYEFRGRKSQPTQIECFAAANDPHNPNYALYVDIDGNVYQRRVGRNAMGQPYTAQLIPNANYDKLFKI